MESLQSFIDTLHQVHLDNSRQYYFAKQFNRNGKNGHRAIMPATPFIFEYFIYNSIYQIDWAKSEETGKKVEYPVIQDEEGKTARMSEGKQQCLLEEHLREKCKKDQALLTRAFEPLQHLRNLEGGWTRILTNSEQKRQEGKDFFRRIGELGDMQRQGTLEPTKRVFKKIAQCRLFVYNVRCNIFHGSKSMAAFNDKDQCRRIEVYELFIQSLVSLFFLAWGRSPVGADEVQVPVEIPMSTDRPKLISASDVLRHVADGLMKPEDSRLIHLAQSMFPTVKEHIPCDGSLFYPSSGKDIITPVLIGLPFCTDFYFYDNSGSRNPKSRVDALQGRSEPTPDYIRTLKKILNTQITLFSEAWSFEFDGVIRRIHLMVADNKAFLESGRTLLFFFRRGDNEGEGGSDQRWDTELLPEWRKMIPDNGHCIVLTDGNPGGIAPDLATKL